MSAHLASVSPGALVIGIDPGNSGGLVLLSAAAAFSTSPTCLASPTAQRDVRPSTRLYWQHHPSLVARQRVLRICRRRPTDAKVAAFAFGRCRGAIEGTLAALGVPVTMLTVPTWRRAVGLPPGATKEMSRGEAIRRFPDHAAMFARVRDDGSAEASLIAIAGLVRNGGGR